MSDSCFLRVYSLRDKTNREISQRKIREKERGSGRRANSPYFTAQEDTQTLNWKYPGPALEKDLGTQDPLVVSGDWLLAQMSPLSQWTLNGEQQPRPTPPGSNGGIATSPHILDSSQSFSSDCLLSSKCKVHNGGDSGAVSVSFVSTYHLVTVWCRVDFTHYPPLSNEWIQQPNSQQFKRPYPPPLPWKMKQRQNESKRLKEHENIRKQMVNRFRTALLGNEKYEIQQNVPVLFSDI
ncbi:hypothetical protein JEQ12_006756 [Ovis aries]|uniref:Uncharacterized protein n=1 Tax=Ovis aries TaxID=9940 RepID=A0A835ZS60_SHEEP|nr:hypothetical protein JEQ12_006756 [Ovis aries]